MRNALSIIVALFAAAAFAGFDDAIWPMYLHPAKTDAVESNTVEQLSRRQIAAGTTSNNLVKVSFWRSRSGNLQSFKTVVLTMLKSGSWVQYYEIGGNILGSVLASNSVPVYNTTNYLAALSRWGLPTNYLTYTPWSDLSGIGGFTNELSVIGHPHGVTNSTTAKGGTDYPAGRSCWYTTDYGWDGMRVILTNLVARVYDYEQGNANWTYVPNWGYYWWATTYAEAINKAETTNWMFNSENWYYQGIGQSTFVYESYLSSFEVITFSHSGYAYMGPQLPAASTGWVTRADFYFSLGSDGVNGDDTNSIFDGQSYGWTTNRVEAPANIETNCRLNYAFTASNPPPNWPQSPGITSSCRMGWTLDFNKTIPVVVRYAF